MRTLKVLGSIPSRSSARCGRRATAAMIGTMCRNRTISPGKGSGSGLRITSSNHAQHPSLKAHIAMPTDTKVQNRRVCPRLSKALRAETINAAPITSRGIRSPTAKRNKGLGTNASANAKASSRPTPPRSAEMWSRDTTLESYDVRRQMFRSRAGYVRVLR